MVGSQSRSGKFAVAPLGAEGAEDVAVGTGVGTDVGASVGTDVGWGASTGCAPARGAEGLHAGEWPSATNCRRFEPSTSTVQISQGQRSRLPHWV